MNEGQPLAHARKDLGHPEPERFLALATWVSNVLFLLGIVSAISALVSLERVGNSGLAVLATIGQALGAALCFLLGPLVSAGARILVRCVISVEQPRVPPPDAT